MMKGSELEYRTTVRLLKAVKRQIREAQGPDDRELASYYHDYKDELARVRASRSTIEAFLDEAATARVTLVGDFHTLEQAQDLFVEVLDGLGRRKLRPIIVLEMVQARHDAALYHYLKGRIGEDGFLEETGYFENWGFDFTHYKPILEYARRWRLTMHGLNKEGPLRSRDHFMAHRLKHLSEQHGRQPLVVLVGDLHLAKDHLPREMATLGLSPVILFQNSVTVYLKKLRAGQDPVGWWRLGAGRFLNNNTAPQVKMQTYLTWTIHGGEALYQLYGYAGKSESEGDIELSSSIERLVPILLDLFGYNRPAPSDFQVYEGDAIGFLDDAYFKAGPGRRYALLVRDARSLFVLRDRLLYLPRLDLNRTVEETAHLLMDQWLPTGRALQAFLGRIRYFASGFLASKLMNPTRPPRTVALMRRSLEDFRRMPEGKDRGKLSREAAVNEHALAFWAILADDVPVSRKTLQPLLRADWTLLYDVSRAVGYCIGQRLYELYDEGQLAASDLKRYVFDQDSPFYLMGLRLRTTP